MSRLQDELADAEVALVSANANDAACIGRIQASVRLFREFLDGNIRYGVEQELAEKEKKRNG